ncbi:hypothetical protein ACFCZ1_04085, partial [Streptomyces sp. NPDC056224]|uniref:hypothetical protein n=1 Tax=Streptomyces sp. NPDC056224 TaxID=3345750 RepID=UPI0035D5C4E4
MAIQAPGHVNDMLFVLVGEKLIEANEDLAHGSHKPFRQMSRELRELSELTEESIVRARNALPPRVGDDYARAMSPFVGEGGHLKQFAGQLDVVADGRVKTSYQVMEAKWQILAEVIRLMMELLAVFALSVFSAGAAAGRAAVARARSRVVVLTVMDRLFKSMHALPVLSEAFEEAFQSFAVRLGMIAFTSGEFSPKGFDWTQIAQDAATGAFMGAFFPVIAKGSQGSFAAIRGGLGRGAVVKDVAGDVSSKVGAAVDRAGVNHVPGGKGGAGDVAVAGRGYQRPGVVSGFLAEGGSESLAEVLSGGLFHGNWSSSAATFFGAGISGQVTQKLHSGAVASGTWINTTFSVQGPSVADGVADTGPAPDTADTADAGQERAGQGVSGAFAPGVRDGGGGGQVTGPALAPPAATVSSSDTGRSDAEGRQSDALEHQAADAGAVPAPVVGLGDGHGAAAAPGVPGVVVVSGANGVSSGVAVVGPVAGETISGASVPRSTVGTAGSVPDIRTGQAGSAVGAEDTGAVRAATVAAAPAETSMAAGPRSGMGLDSSAPSRLAQTTSSDLTPDHGRRGEQDLVAAAGPAAEQVRTVETATAATAPSTPSRFAFADAADLSEAVPAEVVADRSAAVSGQTPGQVAGQVPDAVATTNQPSVFPGRGLVEGQSSAAAAPRSDTVVPGSATAVSDSASRPVGAVSGDPVTGEGGVAVQQSVEPAWRGSESVGAVPFQGVAAPSAVASQTVSPAALPGRSAYQADGASGQSADQVSVSGRTASQPSASPGRISTESGGATTHATSGAHDAHDEQDEQDELDGQEEARRPGRFGTVSGSSAGDGPMDTAVQGRNGVDAVWSTDSASAPAGAVGESVVSGVAGGFGVSAEQALLGSGQADSDRWIPYGRVRSGVKVRYLLDRLPVGPGDGSVADLLGVGVAEVDGFRRGVRVPSEAVGERIDVVWRLLQAGRTGLTSADVDDAVNARGAVSGPAPGGRGMSEVAPAVNYLAEGLDPDELRYLSEALESDPALESGVEPVASDEVVSGLDADEWAGVLEALESDSASEAVAEPVPWGGVVSELDADEWAGVSSALESDSASESEVEPVASDEGAGGEEGALSLEGVPMARAFVVGDAGSQDGAVAGGGRGGADADVVAARGVKRRRLNGGRPVVEAAAAVQAAGGEVAAGAGAAQDGGPARSLLQLKLERVRDALGSVDGVDPVERLAEVVQIPAGRVRGMVGGVKQTGVTGEHRERIDAAFGLLNEGAALTAEAVDERVRARWTPLQATMVYLMEQAGVPGRTAEGVRLSDLLHGLRQDASVYRYRWGAMTPTMKVGDRINALKRLFEAGEGGLTPARVDAEVTRYRGAEGVDFAGKLAYLRGKLGGVEALVDEITASDATLNISSRSVRRYEDPDYDANPPMDVVERVDDLYVLYRELDDVAEKAGLPTGGTLSAVQVKTGCLRESLGEGELPRLLEVTAQEVSSILSGRVKAPDTKVVERIDAAYGLLEEGAAVTAEAVAERVRARWTPLQKTMVSLLDGVGGAATLSDLLGVNVSSVRYMRSGFQRPRKKIGDRIRALERLLSARVGGPLPTRAEVSAAVAAVPAYDLTARVRYLVQVAGTLASVVGELNAGRGVGEPKIALTTLTSCLQGSGADPTPEFADRIDRACHDFWRLGFRPVDGGLAGVLRGEVAAAMAARSVAG